MSGWWWFGCWSWSFAAVTVGVFGSAVAGSVVGVAEVPGFAAADGLVAACAGDVAAGDGWLELGAHLFMGFVVAAFSGGAALPVYGVAAGVAAACWVGGECGASVG